MRLAASLLAVSITLPALAAEHDERPRPSPAPAHARGEPGGEVLLAQYAPPRPAPSPEARGRAAPAARPAPVPYRTAPAPGARGGRRYHVHAGPAVGVGALSFWGGWGWGWGYYPLYPAYPAYPAAEPYAPGAGGYPPAPGYPAAGPERVLVRLGMAAAGMHDGAVGGFTLALDGRTAGFSASLDALAVEGVTHYEGRDGDAIGWGSAHLTWTVLADAAFRIRLELGGSMLALPETGAFATATRAGDVAFGPDVGFSGQLGLVGPVGVEGHARITPLPIPVVDSRLALALRGGPFAVTAGWRGIRVHGEAGEVPDVDFSGPELGLSVVF